MLVPKYTPMPPSASVSVERMFPAARSQCPTFRVDTMKTPTSRCSKVDTVHIERCGVGGEITAERVIRG